MYIYAEERESELNEQVMIWSLIPKVTFYLKPSVINDIILFICLIPKLNCT